MLRRWAEYFSLIFIDTAFENGRCIYIVVELAFGNSMSDLFIRN